MKKLTTEEFIEKARIVHGDRYDYTKTEYDSFNTKVAIICPKHGKFLQKASKHLIGQGCPLCKNEAIGNSIRSNTNDFVGKSIKIHGGKYDYSKVYYTSNNKKVCIICPIHGEFWQLPSNHLRGDGCPKCSFSHGELRIEEYLKQKNIEYESQYPIKLEQQMFSRNNLKVDFYLPKHNSIIEFNGEQHYKYMSFFHKTEEDFQMQVERDRRLKQYCRKHKNRFIEIKYDQIDKIDKILDKKLKLNNKH